MAKLKILLNAPSYKHKNLGGVANHCAGLKDYWSESVFYNAIGKRSNKNGSGKYWLPWDIVKFIFKICIYRPDFVWLNPSIANNALRRDFIFLNIAKFFRVKVAIFIHGFNLNNFRNINKIWLVENLNKANFIMVLAQDFKSRLISAGVTCPIELTTTKVEDGLLEGFDINTKDYSSNKLLFLARVEKEKGIYQTLDTYSILKKEMPNLSLQISGGGSELMAAQEYVKSNNINDVIFTGFIDGENIKKAYKEASLLILISYSEGMPTNVLEGMAFGLPIVTRPVGGLADFFENNKMGFITQSFEPKAFADGIREILNNPEYAKMIGNYNYGYAKNKFYASSVARQLECYYKKYNNK